MATANPVIAWDPYVLPYHDYIVHYRDEALKWIGLYTEPEKTWRKLGAHFRWTGSTDTTDDMYVTMDIVNITAGAIDGTWTSTDYTSVETKLDTFWNAIASYQSAQVSLMEYRWYVASFNDYTSSKPFAPHGAPERITTRAIIGANAGAAQAAQVAMTITFITPFPRNWGRIYIPGLYSTMPTTGVPRIPNAACDAVCAAAQALNSTLHSSDFQLVVPLTSLGTGKRGDPGIGTPNRRLSSITKMQVDNVFDVQRRRRAHRATYRKTLP